MTPARESARALLHLRHLRGRRPPRRHDRAQRFRAVVAYDGTDWAGWQRQHAHVSVAEMLEAALSTATAAPVSVHSAGRTDAGVHAEGQVISFDSPTALPPEALLRICEMILPASIRVALVELAPAGWNPQRDALAKLYRYRLRESVWPSPALDRVAWNVAAPLDLGRMRAAAALLVGRHDFRSFRTDPGPTRRGQDTVREVTGIDLDQAPDVTLLDVRGPGFLYMMVRNITAALVEVGLGRREPSWAGELLAARDRRLGPPPAPACGLTLARVWYADGFGDRLFE